MIKVVPDTNILISAIFWRGVPYKVIWNGLNGKYQFVLSLPILEELIDRLLNKFKVPKEKIEEIVNILFQFCDFVELKIKVNIVKEDSADNRIIETAIEGRAKYIVTGDSHLLKLGNFGEIKVVSARELVKIFKL